MGTLLRQKPTLLRQPDTGIVRRTSGVPSSNIGVNDDWAWDIAAASRGALYEKQGGLWTKAGWASREATDAIAKNFSPNSARVYVPPAASSSSWNKNSLAAQSGSQITFAGAGSNAYAILNAPGNISAINAAFAITTLPVGASLGFGVGMLYGGAWPVIAVSPSGVMTLLTGFGDTVKTFSTTLLTTDIINISSIPGHTVVSIQRNNALMEFYLFAANFAHGTYWGGSGVGCQIVAYGAVTAGVVNWGAGMEIVL